MTFKLGLTGSIGMGKSTTAQMFVDRGCALWDADAAVHRLYAKGGSAVKKFAEILPEAIEDDQVSRKKLKLLIERDPNTLKIIERIVHPLVRADRERMMVSVDVHVTVFDIPLLFETDAQDEFDAVACVHVSDTEQKRRVLARGTMSEDQFHLILSKQMPIADKLARSDYQIETSSMDAAAQQVDAVLADISKRIADA
ncbi:MAG: dephospho-CoA kinase [Pseudomonadota bacterium]